MFDVTHVMRSRRFALLNSWVKMNVYATNFHSEVITMGLLANLWELSESEGDDSGKLVGLNDSQVAKSIGWLGKPSILLAALFLSDFILSGVADSSVVLNKEAFKKSST